MVPVIYSPGYQKYDFGPEHPFSPLRQEMLLSLLKALGHAPAFEEPPLATHEELLTVHAERYLRKVEQAERGEDPAAALEYGLGTADTPIFPHLNQAAKLLVGGTLEAARKIAEGKAQVVLQLGAGLHHATYDKAGGFCVYNDLAAAAKLLAGRGLRVAYLDIDVHHSDGVQWILYEDPRALTLSLHESGRYLFPGSGNVHELGVGEAVGSKLNLPLEPFTEDQSYLEVFEMVAPRALAWFKPDVLIVQSGADAHFLDPLADLLLTSRAYEQLFKRILQLAAEYAGGRVLFTLGGGYSLDATPRIWALLYFLLNDLPLPSALPQQWLATWNKRLGLSLTPTLHDLPRAYPEIPRKAEIERRNRQVAERLLDSAGRYWQP